MNALILYRPNSPHERLVLDYLRDFKLQTGKDLSVVDADTPQGAEMRRLYDVVDLPAILARDSDGRLINQWVGELLPRASEVSYYVQDTGGSVLLGDKGSVKTD